MHDTTRALTVRHRSAAWGFAGAATTALAAVYLLAMYAAAWSAFASTADQSLLRLITS